MYFENLTRSEKISGQKVFMFEKILRSEKLLRPVPNCQNIPPNIPNLPPLITGKVRLFKAFLFVRQFKLVREVRLVTGLNNISFNFRLQSLHLCGITSNEIKKYF